jgi:hypothetical protein
MEENKMFTCKNNNKTGMVTTLAGLTLLGLTLSVAATAQNKPMMDSDRMMSNMDMSDPAPVQYPIAPAGGADMYHYVTYRGNTLTPGSVYMTRMEQERIRDMRLHRTPIMEDPLMVDPAPWEYPIATPGGLDLYHFETYHSNSLVPGSVYMARLDKERASDMRRHIETKITDNEDMADQSPVPYPLAPAGGADLYHYNTYRQNTVMAGSVTEMRERNERKRDKMRMQESPSINQDNSNK